MCALALRERNDGHFLFFAKLLHLRNEGFGDRIHQRTGGELVTTMKPEKTGDSTRPLQRGHVHVQVHSVDSLDFQRYVLSENFGDRP